MSGFKEVGCQDGGVKAKANGFLKCMYVHAKIDRDRIADSMFESTGSWNTDLSARVRHGFIQINILIQVQDELSARKGVEEGFWKCREIILGFT